MTIEIVFYNVCTYREATSWIVFDSITIRSRSNRSLFLFPIFRDFREILHTRREEKLGRCNRIIVRILERFPGERLDKRSLERFGKKIFLPRVSSKSSRDLRGDSNMRSSTCFCRYSTDDFYFITLFPPFRAFIAFDHRSIERDRNFQFLSTSLSNSNNHR